MGDFVEAIAERTRRAKHVRMTTALGQDIEFDNDPDNPIRAETGYWDKPGTAMLNGQIAWTPVLDSINGTLVFDGSLVPQIGVQITDNGKVIEPELAKLAAKLGK
ncbi:hypothetical protein C818_03865 [Lachnospiraceae bacterium MD308]|nr:hypothetical protein C818_03865 [Lachnospiraceae bacterium MD308]MCI8502755.1 hypothetical protein [Dorea sp.]